MEGVGGQIVEGDKYGKADKFLFGGQYVITAKYNGQTYVLSTAKGNYSYSGPFAGVVPLSESGLKIAGDSLSGNVSKYAVKAVEANKYGVKLEACAYPGYKMTKGSQMVFLEKSADCYGIENGKLHGNLSTGGGDYYVLCDGKMWADNSIIKTDCTITVYGLGGEDIPVETEPEITAGEPVNLTATGGNFTFTVKSNVPVKLESPMSGSSKCGWIEVLNDGNPKSTSGETFTYECYAFPNVYSKSRTATIRVVPQDGKYNVSATATVNQAAGKGVEEPVAGADTKLTIVSGTASEYQPSSPITNLFDGKKDDDTDPYIYHSRWSGTTFPVTLTFKFASASRVSYFYYWTRFSDGANGNPGKLDVQYRTRGSSTFQNVKSGSFGSVSSAMYDLGQTAGPHMVKFPQSIDNVEEVKLIFYNGRGGFLSGVEIEFYSGNSDSDGAKAALDKIFTDTSYSQLRPGVTRQDIINLFDTEPYFAENVAMPLYTGTYNGYEYDFRAAEYEAYSICEDMASKYRTLPYTRMDNPTGIYVNKGEKFKVCVGPLPAGNTCYIGIAGEASNGYTARYDGFDFSTGELVQGINEFTAGASGMCYVVNRANNLTTSSGSVKVHFIPGYGRVVGYFDLKRHTDNDYKTLLAATPEKYFVAKGENIIFNMHTSSLRTITPNSITSTLKTWDEFLGWELELIGLAKQNSDGSWDRLINQYHFNNHLMAVSTTDSNVFMDTTNYRINFNLNKAPSILNRETLLNNEWGVAHEMGHVNQMFMRWKSSVESSNNLFSNYVRYKIGRNKSNVSPINALGNYYADGKTWVTMGIEANNTSEDSAMHTRMFWQLWVYFHRCGVDTNFWKRLHDTLCLDQYSMTDDPGQCQMRFAEAVCATAQMDFTDFFEAYGFLRPVNISYGQYSVGECQYTVTQTMIDNLKAKMKSYSKKAPAIHFINDWPDSDPYHLGYYTTFQNKQTITGTPKYHWEGNLLYITNCTGAVGVEFRDPGSGSSLGTLRYFCDYSQVLGSSIPNTSNMKVYVVQWDGTRIEATKE